MSWATISVLRWGEVSDSEILIGGEADKVCSSGLDVGGEEEEGNQDGSYVFSLGNWGDVVLSIEIGKWELERVTWKEAHQFIHKLSVSPQTPC